MNRKRLRTLEFEQFMDEFRSRWLPKTWVEDLRNDILGSRLDPKLTTFEAWASKIQTLNVALRGTDSHLDDDLMRRQLEANIDLELRSLARKDKVPATADFLTWMARMTELDNDRQSDRKRIGEIVDEKNRVNKHPYDPSRSSNPNRAKGSSNAAPPAGMTPSKFPPKLTEEERKLLQESEGCFKCRVPYAGHRAEKCTVTPTGENYRPLTAQDVLRVKNARDRSHTHTAPLAATADLSGIEQNMALPLAAVFPSITSAEQSFLDVSNSTLSSVSASPIKCEHLVWQCTADDGSAWFLVNTTALLDSGAHMVFIRPDLVEKLALHVFHLTTPEKVSVAIDANQPTALTHYARLTVSSRDGVFKSKVLNAIIAPNLCMPIILGLPFLTNHNVICDYAKKKCSVKIDEKEYNLLTPGQNTLAIPDTLASVQQRIKELTNQEDLKRRESTLRTEFASVFEPLPHVDKLPIQPRARIRLKDPDNQIKTRNYPCPRKWKEAWHTLLQQHLDAGRIRPSSVAAGSGAFIIPKADPTALPRWVNDYRQLNMNTITDCFPIPRVNEILADCATGFYFATIDMMNSFFQTRMQDEDIELTAVNTPWGLYEWTVMPMGIKNAPAIHQRRVSAALRKWIGRICHVYIDDIAIWSKSLEEHEHNVRTILTALKENSLYCNPKKTKLFSTEIRFLGHRVSARGIEADKGKADRIKYWPTPTNAKQVRGFLGLVRYLAAFLPKIAEHTTVLDELTKKECDKHFPPWTTRHQVAFNEIKTLVTSPACLTTIDPALMPEHKIFVTTDASDTGSSAILSFGKSYETARPVAYESRSFKGAELNYPVHEKELLAII